MSTEAPIRTDNRSDAAPGAMMPLLAGRVKVARELLDISPRLFDKLRSEGRIPDPVTLSTRPLWDVADLVEWVRAGTPSRDEWRRIRARRRHN